MEEAGAGPPDAGGPHIRGGAAEAEGSGPARLTVVGTGHVFRIATSIQATIVALRPDVVFVELDPGRYQALEARRRGVERAGPAVRGGFIHRRLQSFQESVAGMYGAEVGEEMLAAVDGARAVGARCMLIDPPAQDTVRRALKALTWRERARALGLMVKGAAQQLLPGRRKGREDIEEEIRRYQQDPDAALAEVRRQFPSLYDVVIAERDRVMAARILRAMAPGGHGLAVLGDGHVPGVLRELRDGHGLEVDVFRLADVREGRLPVPAAGGGTSSFSFGFESQVPGP